MLGSMKLSEPVEYEGSDEEFWCGLLGFRDDGDDLGVVLEGSIT